MFDLETGSVAELWRGPPRADYVRLMTWWDAEAGEARVTADHDRMRELLAGADELVGHNVIDFDLKAAARHLGLDYAELVAKAWDTRVAAYVVWPVMSLASKMCEPPEARPAAVERSLDALAARIGIDGKTGSLAALARKHARAYQATHGQAPADPYAVIPVDDPDYIAYALRDTAITAELYTTLQHQIVRRDYMDREQELARLAGLMSWRGLQVDIAAVTAELTAIAERRDRARVKLNSHGVTFGPGGALSGPGKARVVEILAAAGHVLPTTAKGNPSVTADALTGIDHPVARAVAELVAGTSAAAQLAATWDPDGVVHSSIAFPQAAGRWSITSPATATFAKSSADRSLIVARPGHVLTSVDFASIDVRAMAALSRDEAMAEGLAPGRDWHTDMAVMLWEDPSRRKEAKAMAHAINYGIGPRRAAAQAGISQAEAERVLDWAIETYPDLATYKRSIVGAAESERPIKNGWGREMRCHPHKAYTEAPGLAGQGWARDAAMHGLLRLAARGLDRYIVLFIHDEFLAELPEDQAEDLTAQIVDAITFEVSGVPVLAEAGAVGRTWAECYR